MKQNFKTLLPSSAHIKFIEQISSGSFWQIVWHHLHTSNQAGTLKLGPHWAVLLPTRVRNTDLWWSGLYPKYVLFCIPSFPHQPVSPKKIETAHINQLTGFQIFFFLALEFYIWVKSYLEAQVSKIEQNKTFLQRIRSSMSCCNKSSQIEVISNHIDLQSCISRALEVQHWSHGSISLPFPTSTSHPCSLVCDPFSSSSKPATQYLFWPLFHKHVSYCLFWL